jgi:ribosomal protein S18 acetylase RimI-like enzyme
MKIIIRKMVEDDISSVAEIHRQAFSRQRDSKKWIICNFKATPRMQYYVAMQNSEIVGYIHWTQKSGFRPEVVLELEQIAVLPLVQGRGIGRKLIEESLPQVKEQLHKRNASLKHIIVTTRDDNYAQRLYLETIGAKVECTIKDLFSADEVIMIARNVDKKD